MPIIRKLSSGQHINASKTPKKSLTTTDLANTYFPLRPASMSGTFATPVTGSNLPSQEMYSRLPRYTNTLPIINDQFNYVDKSGHKPKGNKLRNFYLPFGALFLKILTLVTILKDRQQITLYIL